MTHTLVRGARPLRASARGKEESFECCCFVVTTFLPTYNLANLVWLFKTADALMCTPLSRKPKVTLL